MKKNMLKVDLDALIESYAQYKRDTKHGAEANCADEYRWDCFAYEDEIRRLQARIGRGEREPK